MRNMPHTDARIVIFFVLLLVSWFFRHIQFSKYNQAVKFLTNAASQNLPLKSGGTKQTLELHKRASDLYEAHMKDGKRLQLSCTSSCYKFYLISFSQGEVCGQNQNAQRPHLPEVYRPGTVNVICIW
jgi:hypothetical protein